MFGFIAIVYGMYISGSTPSINFIITEDNNQIITEDGNDLITEF